MRLLWVLEAFSTLDITIPLMTISRLEVTLSGRRLFWIIWFGKGNFLQSMRKFGGITFFKKNPGAEVISSDQLLDKSHSSTPPKKNRAGCYAAPIGKQCFAACFFERFWGAQISCCTCIIHCWSIAMQKFMCITSGYFHTIGATVQDFTSTFFGIFETWSPTKLPWTTLWAPTLSVSSFDPGLEPFKPKETAQMNTLHNISARSLMQNISARCLYRDIEIDIE